MEEIKQQDTCRMREGWCRDCESTEYKDGCLVSPTVNELLEQLKQLKEENKQIKWVYNDSVNKYNKDLKSLTEQVEHWKDIAMTVQSHMTSAMEENSRLREREKELISLLKICKDNLHSDDIGWEAHNKIESLLSNENK